MVGGYALLVFGAVSINTVQMGTKKSYLWCGVNSLFPRLGRVVGLCCGGYSHFCNWGSGSLSLFSRNRAEQSRAEQSGVRQSSAVVESCALL